MKKKVERILTLYCWFLRGDVVNKKEMAEHFRVNERTIQRDITDIRGYMEGSEEINKRIVYSPNQGGYMLIDKVI